jgi:hypothetical protein
VAIFKGGKMEINLNTMLLAFFTNMGVWLTVGLVGLRRGNVPPARVIAMAILSSVLTVLVLRGVLSDLLWQIAHHVRIIAKEARYLLRS